MKPETRETHLLVCPEAPAAVKKVDAYPEPSVFADATEDVPESDMGISAEEERE